MSKYGLINNDIRRKAWPLLLNSSTEFLIRIKEGRVAEKASKETTPSESEANSTTKGKNTPDQPPAQEVPGEPQHSNPYSKKDKVAETLGATRRNSSTKKAKTAELAENEVEDELFMTCEDDEFATPMARFENLLKDDSSPEPNFSFSDAKESQFVFVKKKGGCSVKSRIEDGIEMEFRSVIEASIESEEANLDILELSVPELSNSLDKKAFDSGKIGGSTKGPIGPLLSRLEVETSSAIANSEEERAVRKKEGEESNLEMSIVDFTEVERNFEGAEGLSESSTFPAAKSESKELSEEDRIQVKKDINRSMYNFDFFNTLNEETAEKYTKELEEMLITLLSENKYHYYQGYNELISVFLLILGKKQGMKAAEVVSEYLIKDFLFDSFEKGVRPMLFMLNNLLEKADSDFYGGFSKLGVRPS